MQKLEILARIGRNGVVAVVRATAADDAIRIAEACVAGGVDCVEITYTVPGADAVIHALAERFASERLLVGAGTVLDPETARRAILAGARFIVGPSFSAAVAALCHRYAIPYLPGTLTPTEMVTALEAGCDVLKLFPGSAFGPSYVKAVRGPLPQVDLMPTGGVTLENAGEWITNGAFAIGVGGELTGPAKQGDFAAVERLAAAFVAAVAEARAKRR